MRRSWLALLVLSCLVAAPASAQITGTPFELSAQAGLFQPDARDRLKDGAAYGGSFGMRFQSWFVLEGHALFAPSESELDGRAINFSMFGADLRFNMRPADERFVPYVLTGVGYGVSHDASVEPAKLERGAPSLGLGFLANVLGPRSYLRFQVRDVFFRGRDADEFANNIAVTAGLHYLWGGRPKDVDLDGVRDWLDKCPATPIGAKVDANGCPLDADADSVFDGLDQCPDTPRGAQVDAHGCPTDSDGDGVWDGIDQCADTPKGVSVDAQGCPNDDDRDGVVKGVDQCEGTPIGCQVDERGCPKDADHDGVCDGLDRCPDTPAGAAVDSTGCPLEMIRLENELLDTGMIRVNNIQFSTGKADITPESMPVLDKVGQTLGRFPAEMTFEIRGHTDDKGAAKANQRLSEARARSVLDQLTTRFPLARERFTVKGMGESRPVAPNTTEQGRAANRRVEFVVVDRAALRREIERRRLERSGQKPPAPAPTEEIRLPEPAPPDTTRR